jgi:hypothetical protein
MTSRRLGELSQSTSWVGAAQAVVVLDLLGYLPGIKQAGVVPLAVHGYPGLSAEQIGFLVGKQGLGLAVCKERKSQGQKGEGPKDVIFLWCYGVMVLWCYGVSVLWCYGVMVFRCYGVMVLSVLWCYGVPRRSAAG